MKLFAFLLLLVPSLAMSLPIKGTMKVGDQPLRIKKGNKTVNFGRGEYTTIIDLVGQRKRMQIEVFRDNIKTKAFVRIPKGFSLPANGEFVMRSENTGAGFDIYGNIRTRNTRSETRYGYQGCTYTDERRVCSYDRYGRRYCYWERYQRRGEQEIEYYIRTTHRNLAVAFYGQGGPEFEGHRKVNQRVYTYKGRCY